VRSYTSYKDQELLGAIRRDDECAFAELFARYGKVTYKMAYSRVRSREAAEEIVQSLFITLWDKRATLSINNISSYFFAAVKHRVLNAIESKIVHKKYWDYYKNFIPRQENISEHTVEGMEYLPEKSRKVFRLNHFEGQSIAEIANRLDLSEKAIQYHLSRSLKELRLHLKDFIISLGIWLSWPF
jgi:RNA polymerase sigma factor (sigma-70 family)